MTVIAWDGKTLAADKRSYNAGLVYTVTKLFRFEQVIFGISGDLAECMEVVAWIQRGRKPEDFPACARSDKYPTAILFVDGGKIFKYENTPYPGLYEDKIAAIGSGRDFAMAAMYLGKTAEEACHVACALSCDCGNGVDTMELLT